MLNDVGCISVLPQCTSGIRSIVFTLDNHSNRARDKKGGREG